MKLYVMAKSYDSYGAHTTLTAIGRFLLDDAPAMGEAIGEINLTLYFPDRGPPRPTLEDLFARHGAYRASLPKLTFFRARRKVSIDVASELMDGRDWHPSPRLSLPLFRRGIDEVIAALALLRPRLKASDDFDLPALLVHCEAMRLRIPDSEDDLQGLDARSRAAAKRAFDALSPWEKLDIDWADFHPQARAMLDDPFFWDGADDFAPHGNDTGADLLAAYRSWLKRHPNDPSERFLARLSAQWGYSDASPMDDDLHAEAVIALAFANLKLRGTCDEWPREQALAALARQRQQAERSTGPLREERLAAIDLQQRVLRQTGD